MNSHLTAYIPNNFTEERSFVLKVLAEDFFGVSLQIKSGETGLTILQSETQKLEVPDHFFSNYEIWKSGKKPEVACFQFEHASQKSIELPGWFSGDQTEFAAGRQHNQLPVDIIGMSFFLLSGFADIIHGKLDQHQRYSGSSSFLAQQNLIDRPVLQEWYHLIAELLWGENYRQKLTLPDFKKHISHDVDQPFEYLNYPVSRLFKRLIGDILFRKDLSLAQNRFKTWSEVRSGLYANDPFNNFDELLNLFQQHDITSTFFWFTGTSKNRFDVNYSITHKAVLNQLLFIAKSGHNIGLHPSYESLGNAAQLQIERKKLEKILEENGVSHDINSDRKHVLRWDWKCSPKALSEAGFQHDYTVGYADLSGFRTGVGFPYRAYDWDSRKTLPIYLHPLIVMECTLLDSRYMNLTNDEALDKLKYYHQLLSALGGEFVLLWHNHRLSNPSEMKLFKKFLSL